MSSYTVTQTGTQKEWQGRSGPMIDHHLIVTNERGAQAEVILTQKKETAAPTLGQVIEGHTEKDRFGLKLKKEFKQEGGYGDGDHEGVKKGWAWNVASSLWAGTKVTPSQPEWQAVEETARWLYANGQDALDKTPPLPSPEPGADPGGAPADTSDFGADPDPDDDIPF